MKETFENKIDRFTDDFITFSKSDKYMDRYNCAIHISYDVRQALEGIEVELRERIRTKEDKRFTNIPFQFIIGYILDRFFKENYDLNVVIHDYFKFRSYRKEDQFEVCSSKLTKEMKTNIVLFCQEMKKTIDPKNKLKRGKKINLRSFIDFVLNKFIREYLIGS